MKDGFLKAAALSPALRVADCVYNTQQIIAQLREAAGRGVKLAVFPEFCLTGYTCGDLFLQRTLQQGALTGLQSVLDASKELDVVALVGLPLLVRGKLYNCAAVLCKGQLLGLVPKTALLHCTSLTGYSGGGKKMIAEYESPEKPQSYFAPRIYGLTLKHKHLPEMQKICGLDFPPVFSPIVDDYYKGMAVTIQLQNRLLPGKPTAEDIYEKLAGWYDGQKLIKVHPFGYDGMIAAADMAGRDSLELIVNGHGEQTMVTALFDNLGKGASGAAVQNMNLMLGFEETAGLAL